MIGRYLLLFLGLVSLVWIGYVGSDLIDKKNQFSPSHIFGKEDGRVLIINRLNECSYDDVQFSLQSQTAQLFNSIHPYIESVKYIILSELQDKMFIERTDDWNKEIVKNFFKKADLTVKFTSRHDFIVGEFEGKFNFSILCLSKKGVVKPAVENDEWLSFDEKSSASIVTFRKKAFSITDIYVNEKNQIEYVSKKFNSNLGRQIDDEQLFSGALPIDLSNYHFYEKNFYTNLDKNFSKSPLFQWVEDGFVEFEYKGHTVIVSDYVAGQDPILILNDWNDGKIISSNGVDGFYKNSRLTKKFPEEISQGFYIKTMDDFVVASTSQSVCEQVIADYKLGNTLAMKKEEGGSFYKDLPKKVSERYISDDWIYSNSIYHNRLLQTRLKPKNVQSLSSPLNRVENVPEISKTISLFSGGTVQSIKVFKGKGNVIVLTNEGQLSMFSSGKNSWKKNLGSKAIGEIQLIDYKGNGEDQILCTTEQQIHLFDKAGNELDGFPIRLDVDATNEVTWYKWNGNSSFVVGNEKSELVFFDSKGKKVNNFRTGLSSLTDKIDVWVSNSILLAGAKDHKQCILYNINKKKEHRRYAVENESFALKNNNELFQFSIKNNQLLSIDQKGNRKNISTYNSGKIVGILRDKDVQTIIVRSNNDLHFLNNQGTEINSLHLPFSELDYVSIFKSPDGISFVSVIDGLENSVFIYTLKGELINKVPFDGKIAVNLSWDNSSEMIITSVVDGYVVQYLR